MNLRCQNCKREYEVHGKYENGIGETDSSVFRLKWKVEVRDNNEGLICPRCVADAIMTDVRAYKIGERHNVVMDNCSAAPADAESNAGSGPYVQNSPALKPLTPDQLQRLEEWRKLRQATEKASEAAVAARLLHKNARAAFEEADRQESEAWKEFCVSIGRSVPGCIE